MMSIILAIIGLNMCALVGVLLMARYSVRLVDENGRPVRAGRWQERVIASQEATQAPTRA